MAKKKTEGLVAVIFTKSPGCYNLAYFVGDKAELEQEQAKLLIDEGFAILDEETEK
jgi:hypothetical protein